MASIPSRVARTGVAMLLLAAAPASGTGAAAPSPVATAAPATRTAAPNAGSFAGLEARIPEVMTKGGVPGLAAAVTRGGALVWLKAFGTADASSSRPVAAGTVFEAGALGEPVFAYGLLRLAERGEFDLDQPLTALLPVAELRSDPRSRRITARRVLSHTSGLPNWRRGGQLTIEAEPGDRFAYSGEGYLYLQRAVEAVTGLGVDALVRREVFDPLGMATSSFVWRDGYESTAAVGHDYLQQPAPETRPVEANVAATLHTTVGDYARFLVETLHPTLLKVAAADRMLRSEVNVEPGISWGLGWGSEQVGTSRLFWHWGAAGSSRGFVIGCRETGDGLVVLTNSENGLSAAEPLVAEVMGGTHPAFAWLDVDRYDSPARTIRERVVRAGTANGERGVVRTLDELERAYPRSAFTEKLLNRVGYELLGNKQAAAAAAVFERNVKLYPESWNVYDSLAEAYAANGDTRLAIQFYQKSLKLNPENDNARSALRLLREAPQR